jgi:predicted acylesterase/phospholipase RssA
LAELLPPEEVAYDVVGGISIGSYNAGVLASFPKGMEKTAANYLSTIWHLASKDTLW